MKSLFIIFISIVSFRSISYGQSLFTHGKLEVTKNGHYLQFADGKPFFGWVIQAGNYFIDSN